MHELLSEEQVNSLATKWVANNDIDIADYKSADVVRVLSRIESMQSDRAVSSAFSIIRLIAVDFERRREYILAAKEFDLMLDLRLTPRDVTDIALRCSEEGKQIDIHAFSHYDVLLILRAIRKLAQMRKEQANQAEIAAVKLSGAVGDDRERHGHYTQAATRLGVVLDLPESDLRAE